MKTATISELKKELEFLSASDLAELCLRLAKYKVENKELLTYLLFEGTDENRFIESVKKTAQPDFATINRKNLYLAKKTIRKILKNIKKYVKYSGKKETEVELLLFFCEEFEKTGINISESKVLSNLFDRQILTIRKSLSVLHEDLRYDYSSRLEEVTRG